jgi:uncharacterized protein YqfA (UPF0365 family)
MQILIVNVVILALFVIGLALFLHFVPLGLWISAIAAGVHVGIFTLIGMRLRRVPPAQIVLPLIKANKAGLDVNVNQLEAHFLAGGNVDRVIDALIAAHRAQITLPFERSAAIDLAGRNVLEAVQMSVNPKVIETPFVSAVAKNGIELKVKARVTVRANIDRLVGGAGEATIIARVGEGIVTSVARRPTTRTCWRTPTIFRAPCCPKAWTPGRRSRFCRSISPTWMSAATSAPS